MNRFPTPSRLAGQPVVTGATHQVYAWLLGALGRSNAAADGDQPGERDRGAVSLEQVLWFVAAGAMVAIVATILWSQIRDKADDPIETLDPSKTVTP